MLERIREIEDVGDWLEAFQRDSAQERTALMLSKRIEALDSLFMDNLVMVEVLK